MESLGRLMEIKADDMGMQQALAQAHPGRIALVTDSIADVPEELLGPHVYMLPLHLMADGVSYQDKRSISFDRVRRLSGRLTSSQLNLAELRRFLDPITAAYEQVLILTVSSKMSGIHARCQEYLAQQPQADIRLVDSRVNSGAQGLLALHAARRLQQGAGLQEVADELEGLRERTKIYVSLPNLKAMVASGRLNRAHRQASDGHPLPAAGHHQPGRGGHHHRHLLLPKKKRPAADEQADKRPRPVLCGGSCER